MCADSSPGLLSEVQRPISGNESGDCTAAEEEMSIRNPGTPTPWRCRGDDEEHGRAKCGLGSAHRFEPIQFSTPNPL